MSQEIASHLEPNKVAGMAGGFYLAFIVASVLADMLGHIGLGGVQQGLPGNRHGRFVVPRRVVHTRSPTVAPGQNGESDPPSPVTHVDRGGFPMALIAIALPILPGKTLEWRTFIEELNGPRHQEFADSRRRAGVHERTFLQQTPMGDLVIVTLEGDDPAGSFGQLMTGTDAFSQWFGDHAMAAHGDLAMPTSELPSELVVDSD